MKQINVLHRFSPDRTLELLKFCIDNHRSALQFPRQCVVQTISGRLMLQDMLRGRCAAAGFFQARLVRDVAANSQLRYRFCARRRSEVQDISYPRQGVRLYVHSAPSSHAPRSRGLSRVIPITCASRKTAATTIAPNFQGQLSWGPLFNCIGGIHRLGFACLTGLSFFRGQVNAIEGFGLSVEELMDAFATLVAAGPEKADEAIRRGSIPPALKKAVASDKLWHVWWCCREIVRVGAIEYMHKVSIVRLHFEKKNATCCAQLDVARHR